MRSNEVLVVPYTEFFQVINTQVIDRINSKERRKEVADACTKAWEFLQRESTHLVRTVELDPQRGIDVERFLLLSAMLDAADFYKDQDKTWVLRKVSLLLDSLFSRNVARHTERMSDTYGLRKSVTAYLVLSAFPAVREAFGYKQAASFLDAPAPVVKEQASHILRFAQDKYAEEGVVTLNLPTGTFIQLQEQAFEKFHIPKEKQVFAEGTGSVDIGAFLFGVASPAIKIHERNHMQHAGMRVGSFGSALDEGMTELLTHEELLREKREPLFLTSRERIVWKPTIWRRIKKEIYLNECELILKILDQDERIAPLLEKRYQHDTVENATALAAVLLENFGVQEYLALYLTNPNANELKKNRDSSSIPTDATIRALRSFERIRE